MPDKFKEEVLLAALSDVAGHLGIKKTNCRVLRQFYWPQQKKDIAAFIKTYVKWGVNQIKF